MGVNDSSRDEGAFKTNQHCSTAPVPVASDSNIVNSSSVFELEQTWYKIQVLSSNSECDAVVGGHGY